MQIMLIAESGSGWNGGATYTGNQGPAGSATVSWKHCCSDVKMVGGGPPQKMPGRDCPEHAPVGKIHVFM